MTSRNMRKTGFIILLVVATCLLCLARPTLSDVSADNENINKNTGKSQESEKTQNDKSGVVESKKSDVVKSSNEDKRNDAATVAVGIVDTKTSHSGTVDITSKNVQSAPAVKAKNAVGNIEQTSNAPEQPAIGHAASLNSGALLRGFYVFVGLSVIAVAYIVFRSFRLNKSRPQMVRKYGVLAHKQDIEMRPLPLDEDDEDDTTVFDASGLSSPTSRLQS